MTRCRRAAFGGSCCAAAQQRRSGTLTLSRRTSKPCIEVRPPPMSFSICVIHTPCNQGMPCTQGSFAKGELVILASSLCSRLLWRK